MTVICSLVSFLVGCAVALMVVALCQANQHDPKPNDLDEWQV